MMDFCGLVRESGITVFLSHPELDPASGRMYNTVFIINPDGEIVGRHRKIKTLGGAEAWSTAGWKISPYELDGVQAGVLICADAYKNDVAEVLVSKGAQVLVSPVSWGPGGCGPDGEWEARSVQTGLPIMVCNRTGTEPDELDYTLAESVVAQSGRRLLEATSGPFRGPHLRLGHGHHDAAVRRLRAELPIARRPSGQRLSACTPGIAEGSAPQAASSTDPRSRGRLLPGVPQ